MTKTAKLLRLKFLCGVSLVSRVDRPDRDRG